MNKGKGHARSYSDTSALTHISNYIGFGANGGVQNAGGGSISGPNAVPAEEHQDDFAPGDLLSIFDDGAPADLPGVPGVQAPEPQVAGPTFLSSSGCLPATAPLQVPMQSQQPQEPLKSRKPAQSRLAPAPTNSIRRHRKNSSASAINLACGSTPDDAPSASTTTTATMTSSRGRRTSSGTSALTPEEKKVKRIMANRESAQRSRVKKMNYVADLDRQILEYTDAIEAKKQVVLEQSELRGTLVKTMHERRKQAAALKVQVTKQLAFQEALIKEREGLRIYATHCMAKQRLQDLQKQQLQQQQQQQQQQQHFELQHSNLMGGLQQQQQQQYTQHAQQAQHKPGHGSALELSSIPESLQQLAQHRGSSDSNNSCNTPVLGSQGVFGMGLMGMGSRTGVALNPMLSRTAPAATLVGQGAGEMEEHGNAMGSGVEGGDGMANSTQANLSRGGSDDLLRAAQLFQLQQQVQQQPSQGNLPSSLPTPSLPNWQAAMLANFSASSAATALPSSLPVRMQQHQHHQQQQQQQHNHHRRNYTWDSSNTIQHPAAAFAAHQFHLLQQQPNHQAFDPTTIPDPGSPPALDAIPGPFLPPSLPFNSLQLGVTAEGGLHAQLPSSLPNLAGQAGIPGGHPSARRTTTSVLEGKAALHSHANSMFGAAYSNSLVANHGAAHSNSLAANQGATHSNSLAAHGAAHSNSLAAHGAALGNSHLSMFDAAHSNNLAAHGAAHGSSFAAACPTGIRQGQGIAHNPMMGPAVAGGMAPQQNGMEAAPTAAPGNADGAGLGQMPGPGLPNVSVGVFGTSQGPQESAMSGSCGLESGWGPLPPFREGSSLEHMFSDDYQSSSPPPPMVPGLLGMGEGPQSCCIGFDAPA